MVKQVQVVSQATPVDNVDFQPTAFFDEDGNPVELGGEGAQGPRGPEGPQGPEGPRGPAGQDGADGNDGAPGAPGADGADGFPTETQWNDLVARVAALEGGA